MAQPCDLESMTKKTPETLETKLERLIREHLAEQETAARAAVARAFAAPTVVAPRATARRRSGYTRRASSTVADLAEQLYGAVEACPGETMTVIAARVGEKPRALHRPMAHLKKTGRVRSAGERNYTRYFPMGTSRAA